ncbi:AT-rich interactive domain-containing protein 3C isoform X2 [Alligator mississippiensis]|uniref:AT-rich interactive domain-containing protein 3C isoform X2 n=1 Tax=Alligator mississippiensis TaxID=8496 RepID=UPI0028780C02|nr:AT-rich interactive domain-containing protein 3C isoform X2 [Alligator mississippiensis]
MVENTRGAAPAALVSGCRGGGAPGCQLAKLEPGPGPGLSAAAVCSAPGALPARVLRLEAVMENLQRQQAARLARADGEPGPGPGPGPGSAPGARLQQRQALALRHCQAVRCGLQPDDDEDEEDEAGGDGDGDGDGDEDEEAPRCPDAPGPLSPAPPPPHEWTYEEQFKQLYELDDDPKRKEFLDDLFGFMQKRGTPVNRIPIMAKQVLDLYTLYRLVTDKGGLVEVINKKIWREITKGLNLPTSITSAAFTLRTQYMKYLYPYECEKRALSSPGELQAAIDSNRREGRRQSFSAALFSYSPVGTPAMLASPKGPVPALALATHGCSQLAQVHAIKKEDGLLSAAVPGRLTIPVSLAGHHLAAASQAAALEQLREKLETGEPPEKKMALMAEEQQRLVQHALQQNLLAMASQLPMSVKIGSRDDRQETALNLSTTGISSINMSIEINGVVYTGVLFARRPAVPGAPSSAGGGNTHGRASPAPSQNQLLSTSSHSHTPASTSP